MNLTSLEIESNLLPDQVEKYILVNEFKESSVLDFYKNIRKLEADSSVRVIPILIDSYGGQVYSLLAMLDIMSTITKPIATIALGKAMSCGAILLSAGTKGFRFIGPNSYVMIHEVSSFDYGKTEDMKNSVEHTKTLNSKVLQLLAKNSNKTATYIQQQLKKRSNVDWYLDANETKKLGLVDHVSLPHIVKG